MAGFVDSPTRSSTTISGLGLAVLALAACAALVAGCGQSIPLPNRAPAAGFDHIEGSGASLLVYYRLFDYEGDDVAISLSACQAASCIAPTAGIGGDGLAHLPTTPQESVLHLFVWDAGCDAGAASLGQDWTLELTPSDDHHTGPTVATDPFVPSELGATADCPQ